MPQRQIPIPEPIGDAKKKPELSPKQKKLYIQIVTTSDTDKMLGAQDTFRIDDDEDAGDVLEQELEKFADDVPGELPDEDDLREEYDELNDDYTDYERHPTGEYDRFSVKERHDSGRAIYVVSVSWDGEVPIVQFIHKPLYEAPTPLVLGALRVRLDRLGEMAVFIAGSQKKYFSTKNSVDLNPLNQMDLVSFLESKRPEGGQHKQLKLNKGSVSRMLDALYFKVEGVDIIPSKALFKRYGSVSRLTQEQKILYARDFLRNYGCEKMKTIDKAEKLVSFIEQKSGLKIRLSATDKPHDKYKQWTSLIRKVEKDMQNEG